MNRFSNNPESADVRGGGIDRATDSIVADDPVSSPRTDWRVPAAADGAPLPHGRRGSLRNL
jgi:hypothetical protein